MRNVLIAALLLVFAGVAGPAAAQAQIEWVAPDDGPLPLSWTVVDGVIEHQPGGGDIRSAAQYGDFTLDFEWRISPGGNSGVFYRAGAGSALNGPEYQILDNGGHADGKSPLTSAASAYAVVAPASDVTKPVGEWNSARIVVEGLHVEHWLNGVEVLSYQLGSTAWQAAVAASKFVGSAYGQAAEGYIVLQDHGDAVAYRNFSIMTP